jgi:hypothetical protein
MFESGDRRFAECNLNRTGRSFASRGHFFNTEANWGSMPLKVSPMPRFG